MQNFYKLKYEDGTFKIVRAKSDLDVIKKYDLATLKHLQTRVIRLEGEQLAIAIANYQEGQL
jgi:hypothetical protein